MKKIFIISTFFLFCAIPFTEIHASIVGVPYFGGIVTAEYTCNTGLLIYVKDAISTPPFFSIVPYMWLTGELPFLSYIPPHPGQELLGTALPMPMPCILGYIPIGFGFPIIYHGSSI